MLTVKLREFMGYPLGLYFYLKNLKSKQNKKYIYIHILIYIYSLKP